MKRVFEKIEDSSEVSFVMSVVIVVCVHDTGNVLVNHIIWVLFYLLFL